MRTLIAALVVTAASLLAAPAAEAQVTSFRGPGGGPATAGSLPMGTYFAPQSGWSYPYSPVTYGTAAAYDPAAGIPPYSYFVANDSLPARFYAGFGNNDFPFYGRPYGHPYDPWTWPYMSTAVGGVAYYVDLPGR